MASHFAWFPSIVLYIQDDQSNNTIKHLMRGQEITFHDNVSAAYDLFPEIGVLSDNSVFDPVFTWGFMHPLVMSCPASVLVPSALWHVIISSLLLFCCSRLWFARACPCKPLHCYRTQIAFIPGIFSPQFCFPPTRENATWNIRAYVLFQRGKEYL